MVTVIIPCFNQGHFLHQCLKSLRKSTYKLFEVIIVNDGSTSEDTLEVLENIQSTFSDLSIMILNQSNLGLSSARNLGLLHAKSKFVQFLDSDDMVAPKKFEIQIELFQRNPEKECVLSDYYFVNGTGEIKVEPNSRIEGHSLSVKDFLSNWEKEFSIPIHCALFKKSSLDQIKFPTEFRAKEDWIFWTNLSSQIGSDGFLYHKDRFAIYRLNPEGMTKKNTLMIESWVKAQTYLMAKFKHLYTETEFIDELNRNVSHLRETYLINLHIDRLDGSLQSETTFRIRALTFLQKFPLTYRAIRFIYRIFRSA